MKHRDETPMRVPKLLTRDSFDLAHPRPPLRLSALSRFHGFVWRPLRHLLFHSLTNNNKPEPGGLAEEEQPT